jgi:hypothetical protein
MADEEYKEPTNEQLARFLVVHAKSDPRIAHLQLQLHAPTLELLMNNDPKYREAALLRHRQFQDQINEVTRLMNEGRLQCEHILKSGKQCPNHNLPGIMYCGLHKVEHEED